MMKLHKKITIKTTLFVFLASLVSCTSYLEEENFSNLTSSTYYTQKTADDLVVGMYGALRNVYKDYGTGAYGTDMFTTQTALFISTPINDYANFNSSDGLVASEWTNNYSLVSKANTVVDRYENQIVWTDPASAVKAGGIAQAKALRALAYYNLVQQFGGVVLYLNEVNGINFNYTRSSEEAVFTQIITDLEAAIPVLEVKPAQVGRFSKRAAQHLLADAYVTRGYKTFAKSTDFATAAALTEQAIGSFDIRTQTYAKVFDFANQENDEVLFAVQYGLSGGAANRTNNKNGFCVNATFNYPGIARAQNPYFSGSGTDIVQVMPTNYFYNLFAANDTREATTMLRALKATVAATYKTDVIKVGDIVISYPKVPLTPTELATQSNNYWVYQPGNYYFNDLTNNDVAGAVYLNSTNTNKCNFPIFNKFNEISLANTDGLGYRDTFVYRVAETHLIAAEAYLKAGDMTKALFHINRVRERATGVVNYYTTITIDNILDERACELAGEDNRWNILKRTGRLEARIKLYNPHVANHGGFDASVHLLRPIPSKELELSDGSLKQNPGY
ncbi:RagB/SusD family nutrient uptake outer membrane protein [Flavobacterium sp. LT1R49]|uniref:RagB/SusD family nutrient uptake outer membrane protein n=1 Tax=Flavobacterium arabinosi TaxID=3398737 RepID=UPI003A8C8740